MQNSPKVLNVRAPGQTLQSFLAAELSLSRKKAKQLLDDRRVFVNGRRIWMARHPLNKADRVEVMLMGDTPVFAMNLLAETADIRIINKPPGMLSVGENSAETIMREKDPAWRAVHRIDRDTSGCLIMVQGDSLYRAMVDLFKNRSVDKTYRAICMGRVSRKNLHISKSLDGQSAQTDIRVLSANHIASHIEVIIHTGRTHQIRRHLASIGHPVVGDKQYITDAIENNILRTAPRQMLHALSVRFKHPHTDTPISAKAPLPPDFNSLLKQLNL